MYQRRPSRFVSSLLLLVLLMSSQIVPEVKADDANHATTTITMHRDATDIVSNEGAPQQRRELFWSLTFLSKCIFY